MLCLPQAGYTAWDLAATCPDSSIADVLSHGRQLTPQASRTGSRQLTPADVQTPTHRQHGSKIISKHLPNHPITPSAFSQYSAGDGNDGDYAIVSDQSCKHGASTVQYTTSGGTSGTSNDAAPRMRQLSEREGYNSSENEHTTAMDRSGLSTPVTNRSLSSHSALNGQESPMPSHMPTQLVKEIAAAGEHAVTSARVGATGSAYGSSHLDAVDAQLKHVVMKVNNLDDFMIAQMELIPEWQKALGAIQNVKRCVLACCANLALAEFSRRMW